MAKNITEEHMAIIRHAIKEKKDIDIYGDISSILELSLSVSRMTNKYRFSTLDESFDKAVRDEYLRKYRINLTLEDLEQGKDLAKIAYVDIRMVPLSSLYEDMEIIIDENPDSFDTIGSLIHLEEIDMSDECEEYKFEKYPSACVNIAELHTFYISPEFRGLGIADFIFSKLNDLLQAEYNQVVYLLGAYVNPFRKQLSIEEIDMDKIEYCNGEEEDEELLKAMYRSLEKSDFHPMGTDGRHFYKNMFEQGLDEYAYEDDFEE